MTKTILTAAALLALAVAPASAEAKTGRCPLPKYGLVDPSAFPGVQNLRVRNVPTASDYAPPCLVAESVAALIQEGFAESPGPFPRTVRPRGARWDGGRYRCRYERRQGEDNPYEHATCTSVRRASRKVTMDLVA